jgi:hypothetical protein
LIATGSNVEYTQQTSHNQYEYGSTPANSEKQSISYLIVLVQFLSPVWAFSYYCIPFFEHYHFANEKLLTRALPFEAEEVLFLLLADCIHQERLP